MKRTAALALLTMTALVGCGDDGPDIKACEQAMRQQFEEAASSGAEGERPGECDGVSDAELERLAGEIIGEQFEG